MRLGAFVDSLIRWAATVAGLTLGYRDLNQDTACSRAITSPGWSPRSLTMSLNRSLTGLLYNGAIILPRTFVMNSDGRPATGHPDLADSRTRAAQTRPM